MKADVAPSTLVGELMIPINQTLHLSVEDSPPNVIDRGLYKRPEDQPVVISDGFEIVGIANAYQLRSEVLPRSWTGPLGKWLSRLPRPPEVDNSVRVADLDYFVQEVEDLVWILVIDDKTEEPVGVLHRRAILDFLPPPDTSERVYRSKRIRLWGDPSVEHAYFYCPVEGRYYVSRAFRSDAEGKLRDRKGHLVEKRTSTTV